MLYFQLTLELCLHGKGCFLLFIKKSSFKRATKLPLKVKTTHFGKLVLLTRVKITLIKLIDVQSELWRSPRAKHVNFGSKSDFGTSICRAGKLFWRFFCHVWAVICFPYPKFPKKLALLRSWIKDSHRLVIFYCHLYSSSLENVTGLITFCQKILNLSDTQITFNVAIEHSTSIITIGFILLL